MNSQWHGFMQELSAKIVDGEVKDYGAPEEELAHALDSNTLCDLSHLALVRASGDDSTTFLQGQLTNDVRQVTDSAHQLSGYCSPKGRLLALFRLFKREEDYYLQFPSAIIEPTLKRLRMFVMMSKVTLDDISDEMVRFSLSGPDAEAMLQKHAGTVPAEVDQTSHSNGLTVLRVAGKQPRFFIYGEVAAMQSLWQSLAAEGAHPIGADAGRLQDIHAGLPSVVAETVEDFVPQMVNMQLVNGVSFKKGCYTGQEVVARMQYLGKLKRRMYLAHVNTATMPTAGDEIGSPESTSGQGAGRIVTTAPSPSGGYDLLTVLEIASADTGNLFLNKEPGTALELLPLPYALESSE